MNYSETVIKATDAIFNKLYMHIIVHGLTEDLWTFQRLSSDFRLKTIIWDRAEMTHFTNNLILIYNYIFHKLYFNLVLKIAI